MGNDISWSLNSRSLFERFAVGLQEYTKNGTPPVMGDQDIQFGLELQKKRLDSKDLSMELEFEPRGHFPDKSGPGKSWSDMRYVSTMEYRTCKMTRRFYRGGEKEFSDKDNKVFYQTITNVHNQEMVAGDVHSCPDCGAITKLGELQKGCPYCGACFQITDIFPKVTNYYYVKDSGYTEKEIKKSIGTYMLVVGLICTIGFPLYYYITDPKNTSSLVGAILGSLPAGVFGGVVLGYMAWALVHLGVIIKEAGKTVPMLSTIGSDKRFVAVMQKYSPEFSFIHFSDKIVSMLKTIMYAEKPEELPFYVGEPLQDVFQDVVDVAHVGPVGFQAFQISGNYCFVTLDVFLDTMYDKGNRLVEKREKYRVYVKKNMTVPMNLGFSIRHLECKNCGTSFDATKQKLCPGCQSEYPVADEDWVITRIVKK